jgi:hypothetical protein
LEIQCQPLAIAVRTMHGPDLPIQSQIPNFGDPPHNGMVRRGILEVVEFEDGGSHETTLDRYRFGQDNFSFGGIGFDWQGGDPQEMFS